MRPMVERDEAVLRAMIDWEQGEALPEELQKLYWQYRAVGCKGPIPATRAFQDETLLHIVVMWQMGGHVKEFMKAHMPERPFRLIARELEYQDLIQVYWRNAWREAKFHAINDQGEVSFVLIDERWTGEVRKMPYSECREYEGVTEEAIA